MHPGLEVKGLIKLYVQTKHVAKQMMVENTYFETNFEAIV